ncbi:hypothetical protein D6C84_05681 [Aureobasidium pullulans]|uniref:Cytochrome b5 heme-binding domain-containing protein n=1 Tax=Aureobasidium pullulans TaxID=5580 RepID=A0A4S9XUE1_AURPU|nr:hypothetical protein D6C84_05681 [Aureobasidium pullulans]
MGWLQLKRNYTATQFYTSPAKPKDADSEHVEYAQIDTSQPLRYPPVSEDLPDNKLPLIPASTVIDKNSRGDRLWIVMDDIIYDCTDFASSHPGGSTVIQSFDGKDCSWQFWRFHTRKHMRDSGRALRIGRTKGVENPYKEPPRYVGLRKIGYIDEDW